MDAMKELEKLMTENKDVLMRLKEGVENKGHIHCPVNGWDCPYFDANGCCMMWPDTDPINECSDFAFFWNWSDTQKGIYICYDEH